MNRPQDKKEKQLLALERERRKLWRRKREMVPLDTPIQRGWMRCYCLTEDAEKRSDADLLRAILRRINVVRYHWRRSFAVSRRTRRHKRQYLKQALMTIPSWEWRSSKVPQEWKTYFSREWVMENRQWVEVFRFRMVKLFELRVLPRMIHELPVCDPELESRLDEIEAEMRDPKKEGRLAKLKGERWTWPCDERQNRLERLAKKRIRAAVLGDLEAEKRVAKTPSSAPPAPCDFSQPFFQTEREPDQRAGARC